MTKTEAIAILEMSKHMATSGRLYNQAIDMAIEALQTEVVRCKDCIHYESDGGAMMICNVTDMVCDNDDYCSYGERKGGEVE